jgi:hypothetical protein
MFIILNLFLSTLRIVFLSHEGKHSCKLRFFYCKSQFISWFLLFLKKSLLFLAKEANLFSAQKSFEFNNKKGCFIYLLIFNLVCSQTHWYISFKQKLLLCLKLMIFIYSPTHLCEFGEDLFVDIDQYFWSSTSNQSSAEQIYSWI